MNLKNKSQFFGFTEIEWIKIRNLVVSDTNELVKIQEKLRRFVSFHNRNLYKVSKKRFKQNAIFQLENIFELLILKTDKTELNNHLPPDYPFDPSLLNSILFCFDALKKLNSSKVKIFNSKLIIYKKQLNNFLEKKYQQEIKKKDPFLNNFVKSFNYKKFDLSGNKKNEGVVLLSPSRFSLFSLSTLALCHKLKVPIKAIVIRKFSLKRFKDEYRRDGFLMIKKIYRKLILKSDENSDKILISLKRLCNKLTGGFTDIQKMAEFLKIPYVFVNEFEDSNNFLLENKADIALFTGGGFIKKSFLENFRIGIINLHMGILPYYKGMDVVESPLSEGRFDCLGITSHLMDTSIDTGPIIDIYKLSPFEYKNLGSFKNEFGLIMPFLIIDSYLSLINKEKTLVSQVELGRQYYFLHKDLLSIINNVLTKNFRYKKVTNISKFVNNIGKKMNLKLND